MRQRIARAVARLRWQPDKWERLTLVAQMVGPGPETVLDVGGRRREMSFLLRPAEVVSVNVEPPADVVTPAGGPLPFDDDAFDAVSSTDVLEHIPHDARAAHVAELVRVARRRIVLCCPYGSPEKDAAELLTQRRLHDELGMEVDFLEEHIRHGLPREADVRAWVEAAAPRARIECLYQDGLQYGVDLLLDGLRAKQRKDPRALLRFVKAAYLTRRVEVVSTVSADTSRLFMIVDL